MKRSRWRTICIIVLISLLIFGVNVLMQSVEKSVAYSIIITFGVLGIIAVAVLHVVIQCDESDESKKINEAIQKQFEEKIRRE